MQSPADSLHQTTLKQYVFSASYICMARNIAGLLYASMLQLPLNENSFSHSNALHTQFHIIPHMTSMLMCHTKHSPFCLKGSTFKEI